MYDGFVSYSHAADDLLAPRLQAGLQRFAKPWWQRRALRIFRDESSLSANPHLWESIVEAMDDSEWLVLLLSPEAAESEWVNREIEYWKSHKDPSRILPVVTDGSFAWRAGENSGSAVPPALRGVFGGEPRWVDMRFAHSDEHLDLKNPEFLDAVADISSALHGVPKDELASEEVKQHRRTVRTAWAAGLALMAVSVAAVAFGIQSAENARRAEAEAVRANQEAKRAEDLAEEAQREAERANLNASINEMQSLAARSASLVEVDPELATLLALLAASRAPDQAHELTVHEDLTAAIAANRLIWRFDRPSELANPYNQGVISADGSTAYAVQLLDDMTSRVVGIDVESGEIVDTYYEGGDAHLVSVSRDESLLAIAVLGEPLQVVVIDLSTGETVQTLDLQGCKEFPFAPHFSPDGRYLTFMDGTEGCTEDEDADWALVYDTSTWESTTIAREGTYEWVQFANGSQRALILHCPDALELSCRIELSEYPSLTLITAVDGVVPSLDNSGETLVYTVLQSQSAFGSTEIHDLSSGRTMSIPQLRDGDWVTTQRSPAWSYAISPDGSHVAIILETTGFSKQTIEIVETADGSSVARLPEFPVPLGGLGVNGVSWTEDGSRLLTSHPSGLLLWDTSPTTNRAALADIVDPIELALSTLTRGFTTSECSRFAISPCPTTLDDLKAELESSG